MGVRKNAKFLTSSERENFVRACIMMKADIINPAAPASQHYSKWDQLVAIHDMIQNAFAPGATSVNFGHGGSGSYSFLSWHRYFLYQFELELQSHVPGVMLPYWDWTDPSSIMTNTFLGPDGLSTAGDVIQTGYFAFDRPGTGANTTPAPAWWPASLPGFRMPAMFGSFWAGGLKRNTGAPSGLPSANAIEQAMKMTTYPSFQNALESGSGLPFGHAQMHNGMHGWIGGFNGHMSSPAVSPFDPFFYLHHCNIDRYWAMWQADGHATVYPSSGGDLHHHRNDLMYPWVGGASGYGTNDPISASIPMPDFSALGGQRNVDTLDFRNAYGYTYDTLPVIGIGLDRTGSMLGMTPDPMVTTSPDVTKWEAAKRGVSAFLQDCETVQDSGTIYVTGGVKTFRTLGGNQFDPVFAAPAYGLIKGGTSYSKTTFDSVAAGMSPGGMTPLADALLDVQNTLVEPPFGGTPADERRYLAMLTDGILTSGAPLTSIPNGSLSRTAVFAMGFGTGAAVDYGTLATLVAKGVTLGTTQIFHGENAGVIDKFFSDALAAAIGFTTIFDPVLEMFAGEHAHVRYTATSAEDAFLITAQGMDFQDENWSYMLMAPNGHMVYGSEHGQMHDHGCTHCCPEPYVTAKSSHGRLSLLVQRHNAPCSCWVGEWMLMVSYKARRMDKMLMPTIGELIFPGAAGPIRGNQFTRLATRHDRRLASRNIFQGARNGLDTMAVSTNSNSQEACAVQINIYARTCLRISLVPHAPVGAVGKKLTVQVVDQTSPGRVHGLRALGRLISPKVDLTAILPRDKILELTKRAESTKRYSKKYDPALILAKELGDKENQPIIHDVEVTAKEGHDHGLTISLKKAELPGGYHLGLLVTGVYAPETGQNADDHGGGHNGGHGDDHGGGHGDGGHIHEPFTRILNLSVGVE